MLSKEFLLHELENIKSALDATLRHDYLPGDGKEFYLECFARLEEAERQLQRLLPTNLNLQVTYAHQLSFLSQLVSLIERSHIGEFSWAFASRLRDLTRELCAEIGPGGELLHPVVHIVAEGGLTSYAVLPEDPAQTGGLKRLIHVIFPRTLKHDVLVHTILGHEIGHAAWAVPKLRRDIISNVVTPLFKGGPLESPTTAETWLNEPGRAPDADDFLRRRDTLTPNKFSFSGGNNKILERWHQEFFCDLFGLVMFGPSFACAHRLLLGLHQPRGEQPGDHHPPYASRAILLLKALQHLNWLSFPCGTDAYLQDAVRKTEAYVAQLPSTHSWYDVFTDQQVKDATDGLVAVLAPHAGFAYSPVGESTLVTVKNSLQARVPPVGSAWDPAAEAVSLSAMDFRHVLTAGWVYWLGQDHLKEEDRLSFGNINQLCDRGILQQCAVDIVRGTP